MAPCEQKHNYSVNRTLTRCADSRRLLQALYVYWGSVVKKHVAVGGAQYPVEFPDRCPICHRYGDFAVRSTHALPEQRGAEILFECPFEGCRCYFIGYYGRVGEGALKTVRPQKPEIKSFSASVVALSPSFTVIYAEAEEARIFSLNQICGPGYRKAFEFLVKDYAKAKAPERANEIEHMFSGNVVREFVTDPRIESVAKRALWLGNDETHYLRKWADHDINDLLVLIQLTVNWIEIEQLSAKYQGEMPEKSV